MTYHKLAVSIAFFPVPANQTHVSSPSLSIVIPAYNESARIPATLESVIAAVRANKWPAEVVVVNDGSSRADGRPAQLGRSLETATYLARNRKLRIHSPLAKSLRTFGSARDFREKADGDVAIPTIRTNYLLLNAGGNRIRTIGTA